MLEKRLQEIAECAVEGGVAAGVNGLVLKEGKELAYFQAGYRDREKKKEMDRDTICRLFSMSKPITATAVMMLLEQGRFDLMDWISDYIKGFENQLVVESSGLETVKKPVTIGNLLGMTSGLVYPGGNNEAERRTGEVYSECESRMTGSNPMSTVEFAEKIGHCPLAFQPGTSWNYGASADVLGALVESVSGMRYGEFLRKNLFEPLEMNDTGFYVPKEKQERFARSYAVSEEGYKPYEGIHLAISNTMDKPPAFESGGAGLCSTLDDYAKFATMLLHGGEYKGRQILSPRTVEFMTTARLMPENEKSFLNWDGMQGYSYGNLMRILKNPSQCVHLASLGEYGWDGWLGSYFVNAPKEKLTFLLMMQRPECGTIGLTRRLLNAIFAAL